jgi:hypothetical protein
LYWTVKVPRQTAARHTAAKNEKRVLAAAIPKVSRTWYQSAHKTTVTHVGVLLATEASNARVQSWASVERVLHADVQE